MTAIAFLHEQLLYEAQVFLIKVNSPSKTLLSGLALQTHRISTTSSKNIQEKHLRPIAKIRASLLFNNLFDFYNHFYISLRRFEQGTP
jgi:hypothetical protein